MRNNSIVHRLLGFVALTTCMVPVARAANADVAAALKLIPADMALVLVFDNPEGFDKTVKAIGQRIDPNGNVDSVTEGLIENVPFGKHIDLTKPVVMAFAADGDDPDLVCVSVPDFDKKIQTLGDGYKATKDGGVWKIVSGEGDGAATQVAWQSGSFVLLARNAAVAAKAREPKRTVADALKARGFRHSGRDFYLHMNMEPLRATALGGLAGIAPMAPMFAMMASQGGADPAMMTGMITGVIGASTKFVEQLDYMDVSVGVTPKAIDATLATGYKDGPIKSYLAAQKPASMNFFSTFQDQQYGVALGYHMPGESSPFLSYMVDMFMGPFANAPAAAPATGQGGGGGQGGEGEQGAASKGPDPEAIKKAIAVTKDMYRAIQGTNMVLSFSADGMTMAGDMVGSDVKALSKGMRDSIEIVEPLKKQLGFGAADYDSLGERKIGGKSVNLYAVKPDTSNPATAQAAMFLGQDTQFGYAVAGDRVQLFMGKAEQVERFFGGKVTSPLSASNFVKEALSALPAKRNVVMLVDPASIMPAISQLIGMGKMAAVPAGPPIAVSVSVAGEPARVDFHVPIRAIERIVQAIQPDEPM